MSRASWWNAALLPSPGRVILSSRVLAPYEVDDVQLGETAERAWVGYFVLLRVDVDQVEIQPLRERDRLDRGRCTIAAFESTEEVHRLADDGFACRAHRI
jgi:hypothetical protein